MARVTSVEHFFAAYGKHTTLTEQINEQVKGLKLITLRDGAIKNNY